MYTETYELFYVRISKVYDNPVVNLVLEQKGTHNKRVELPGIE